MLRKYVTTMNRDMFDSYGEEMLRTFSRFWPSGNMTVYTEDGELPYKDPRITYKLLYEIPGLAYFLEGIQHFPIFSGLVGDRKDYRFNVNAFARKAFAQMAAAVDFKGHLFWIDADVKTHKHIPGNMLESFLKGAFLCVMKRKTWHTCTSFVGWDCSHAITPQWFAHYEHLYKSGNIFTLPQWDDCTILDSTIDGILGVNDIGKDITGEGPYNVFDSVFQGYATHDKGPKKTANRYGQLIEIVARMKPAKIVEIGTWNGTRAIQMHQVSPESEYVGFDLFEEATVETDAVEKNVKKHHEQDKVSQRLAEAGLNHTLYRGDTKDTFTEYASNGGAQSADLVFIDGGHSLETIKTDLENAYKAVKPGGIIVMDDYYTEMPESELAQYGAQAILKNIPHILLPCRDWVKGGGRVQMAVIEC